MKVREVMESLVVTVPMDATYEEAAKVLYQNDFSGAPVVDKEGRLVGVVSEKDLFRAVFPRYSEYYLEPENFVEYESREEAVREVRMLPVANFMSKKLFTVSPEDPILRAGAMMLAKGVFRLPVLEDEKIIGIVTREHIYRKIFQTYLNLV